MAGVSVPSIWFPLAWTERAQSFIFLSASAVQFSSGVAETGQDHGGCDVCARPVGEITKHIMSVFGLVRCNRELGVWILDALSLQQKIDAKTWRKPIPCNFFRGAVVVVVGFVCEFDLKSSREMLKLWMDLMYRFCFPLTI